MLIPLGVAGRNVNLSRERMVQLANQGRIRVVKDTLNRRFVEETELRRFIRERARQAVESRSR